MALSRKTLLVCVLVILGVAVFLSFGIGHKAKASSTQYAVQVFSPDGKYMPELKPEIVEGSSNVSFTFPSRRFFKPGKYIVKLFVLKDGVVYVSETDFSWGVLALNFNKTVYKTNDEIRMGFAVLDDGGHTICNASADLRIEAPDGVHSFGVGDGSIAKSAACGESTVTDLPDYSAMFVAKIPGSYHAILTATTENGTRTTDASFEVQDDPVFDVERSAATRIFPPTIYRMNIRIVPSTDFSGKITETVPSSFEIRDQGMDAPGGVEQKNFIQKITDALLGFFQAGGSAPGQDENIVSWSADLKKGTEYHFWYDYKAPNISPEFYLVGPLKFDTGWTELRSWQIAGDALASSTALKWAGTAVSTSTGTAWNSPGNATGAPNTVYSTSSLAATTGSSTYLQATNYGFAIPSNASTTGIVLTLRKYASGNSVTDKAIRLVKAGVIQSTDKSSVTAWGTSVATSTYGASNDLWGYAWQPSDINASTFGVAVQVKNTSNQTRTVYLDAAGLQVYYNLPTLTVSATGTAITSVDAGSTNSFMGNGFFLDPDITWSTTTQIVVANVGTVADTNLQNLQLWYKQAASCAGINSTSGLAVFNSTKVNFDASGHATTTGTLLATTTGACIFPVLDVASGAANGNTIALQIDNPSVNVAVANGNVSPATAITNGTTTIIVPTLAESVAIGTTSSTQPKYTFNANEAGTLTYGGSCSSVTTAAASGSNTITFNTLAPGTYGNCTITLKNSNNVSSAPLAVSTFTIDTTPPTASLSYSKNPVKQGDSQTITANFSEPMDPARVVVSTTFGGYSTPRNATFDPYTNSVWVANYGANNIVKVNPMTGASTTYAGYSSPYDLAFDSYTNSVWVANSGTNSIVKVNPMTGASTTYGGYTNPFDITFDPYTNSVWVTSAGATQGIVKVDPTTGASTTYGGYSTPWDITFDPYTNSVWVANSGTNSIVKVNPTTGASTTYGGYTNPRGVVFNSYTNSVWVTNYSASGTVYNIDPVTGASTTYAGYSSPWGIIFDPYTNSLWVSNTGNSTVSKISVSPASISISGSNTVAAANMAKVSSTQCIYTYMVGAGNGTANVTLSNGTDLAGNPLGTVSSNTFTVDNTAPTLTAITSNPLTTSSTAPSFTFSSTEAGTISYSGADCPSSPTTAVSGNNTITFGALSDGSRSCSVTVTDAAGNASSPLNISMVVDTTRPTTSLGYSSNPAVPGTSLTITAYFSEPVADSPSMKISISGANTVSAANMTKVTNTQYTYTYMVVAPHGSTTATVTLSNGTDLAGNAIVGTPTPPGDAPISDSGDTFTVTAVPAVSGIVVNNSTPIMLFPATTTPVLVAFQVQDLAGCSEVTGGTITSTLYRSSVSDGGACTPDDKNCYRTTSQITSCSGGDIVNTTSTFNMQYFADATDASSDYPADNWLAEVDVQTVGNATTSAISSIGQDVETLIAVDVPQAIIDFGSVSVGTNTGSTNQTTTINNVGNCTTSLSIVGADLAYGGNNIFVNNIHYSTSPFMFGIGDILLSSATTTIPGFSLAAPTTTTLVGGNIYFGISIPGGMSMGTYSGTVSFVANYLN